MIVWAVEAMGNFFRSQGVTLKPTTASAFEGRAIGSGWRGPPGIKTWRPDKRGTEAPRPGRHADLPGSQCPHQLAPAEITKAMRTRNIVAFCKKHGVCLDWVLYGNLQDHPKRSWERRTPFVARQMDAAGTVINCC